MNQDQQQALLALLSQPEIKRRAVAQRMLQGIAPLDLIAQPQQLPPAQGRAQLQALQQPGHPAWQQAHQQWQQLLEQQVQLIGPDHAYWPLSLTSIDQAPGWLFVSGQLPLLKRPQLALVGGRHASPAALRRAYSLAAELAQQGWVITSGLAKGIDASAHEGALSQGFSIAVQGCGLGQIYPKQNRALGEQLLQKGLIVSEYPLHEGPVSWHFPARNRIIAGLSQGLVVVEAGIRSGSLVSARLALEQGKEVMAMPGSPDNPNARGGHWLIQQGAALVCDAQDVLQLMGSMPHHSASSVEAASQPEAAVKGLAALVLAELDEVPMPMDLLALHLQSSVQALSPVLLTLELDGRIQRVPGGICLA